MPPVEVRIAIVIILILLVLARRMGFFKWLKEHRQQKAKDRVEQQRREEVRQRRQEARDREEQQRQRTAEILRRSAPGFQHKAVKAAGQGIWYLEGGPPEAPAVLLLHGFAGEKEDWAAFGSHLARQGHRVVAPDLPGFGQNEPDPNGSYDVTSQAKRIRAFIHQLDLHGFHLVGCSMGGTIAAACAYASPEKVLSLTLIEPFGVRVPYQSELDQLLAQGRNPMVIATPAAYDNLLRFVHVMPPAMPPALKQHRAEQAAENRVFYLKVWKEVRQGERAHILDLLLPELTVKTLVILGAKSRVVHGATAEAIGAVTQGKARTLVMEECGHFPMVEQPNETAEQVLKWLAEAPGPAPAP